MHHEGEVIPINEQDDDRWRYALTGRDPVSKGSHALKDYQRQLKLAQQQHKARLIPNWPMAKNLRSAGFSEEEIDEAQAQVSYQKQLEQLEARSAKFLSKTREG